MTNKLKQLLNLFFEAVSFDAGYQPAYERIYPLFIESGLLIKNSGETPEISSVRQFIEPRQALVNSGVLTRFHEVEISATTDVFGNIAHRFSVYAKSGTQKGVAFEAKGVISTQFVRTSNGWKISSMAWDDEREGLKILNNMP
ncbi:MAG: hypothetical protein ABL903_20420 [Methylococcales bacterium]